MSAAVHAPAVPAPDHTAKAILDAARAAVLDFGLSRITLSDVAARAGVSRMTVYNRFGDLQALIRMLMTREFGAVLERVAGEQRPGQSRARTVTLLVQAASELPRNPLFRKVKTSEPELLAPYVFHRLGATQQLALELIVREVVCGQQEGSVRGGDPHAIAAAALLIVQTFVLSAATIPGVPARSLLDQLELALEGLLLPPGGSR